MADYYSILKKTIASLPESNGAARRSVYSRARNAIVNQLKAYEPPLSPSEITSEQLRLEEAIRKVEAEAARESLGLGPAFPEVSAPKTSSTPGSVSATVSAEERQSAPVVSAQSAGGPTHETGSSAPGAEQDTKVQPALKESRSEAQNTEAAADGTAHEAEDTVGQFAASDEPVADNQRLEPAFDAPTADDAGIFEAENPVAAEQVISQPPVTEPEQAKDYSAPATPTKTRTNRNRPNASAALGSESGKSRILPIALAGVLTLAVLGAGAYFFLSGSNQNISQETSDKQVSQVASVPQPAAPSPTPEASDGDGEKNTDRLMTNDDGDGLDVVAPDARTVTTTTINPQQVEEAVPGQPSIVTNVESTPAPENPAPVPDIDTPATVAVPSETPDDSVAAVAPEASTPPAPSASDGAAVQRSILYEEGEDANGAGTAAQGAVVWALSEETGLDGKAYAVLNASVEIPERDVTVDIRFKPNDDTSLPASHLVEIKYEFPEEFAAGDVVNVPGLVMKPTEEARGDALIGASVKVSPGYFWIALSSLPNEQQRNLDLLRERGWIDIPMLYENGKRGILTIEKGTVGTSAVEKAVSAWKAG